MGAFTPGPDTVRQRRTERPSRQSITEPVPWLRNLHRAGSLVPPGGTRRTGLPCGRRDCSGRLVVGRDEGGGVITWRCDSCRARGRQSGWQGLPEDLSAVPPPPATDTLRCLSLPLPSYEVLVSLTLLDAECLRLLFTAEHQGDREVLLSGASEDLERLAECLRLEATVAPTDARRQELLLEDRTWQRSSWARRHL